MTWVRELCDLYDKNISLAGKYTPKPSTEEDEAGDKLVLLPILHSTAKAQIEVSVTEDGCFGTAAAVDKVDGLTLIPITQASDSRTDACPHPLCDKLEYVSGDYTDYVKIDKKQDKFVHKRFGTYIAKLKKWCDSEYTHPKIEAIYTYLSKATLMHDLINGGVLKCDEATGLSNIKISGIVQEDCFVRFRVQADISPTSQDEDAPQEVWLDRMLQEKYIEYADTFYSKKDMCYLSGDRVSIGDLHPRKIRNEGDQAKLISGNDDKNYTYRGRFTSREEAVSVGYMSSQKAHNALKWIIRKQGYTYDGLCFVVWDSDLTSAVLPYQNLHDTHNQIKNISQNEIKETDTNYITANNFIQSLKSHQRTISPSAKTVIMSLDAAVPGRLAVTYYNSMETSRYLENVRYWHETGSWIFYKKVDDKVIRFEGMPSFGDIVKAVYGTEQSGMIKVKSNSGKCPLIIETFNRLLPCVADRKKIPQDIVRGAVIRASTPLAYSENNWRFVLSAACALVKKQRYDYHKEEWSVALDENCKDRSYLYGRLLAVADIVEKRTFDKGGERQTNAMRYMSAFSQRPFRTWQLIEERLEPYLCKLTRGSEVHFRNLLTEICNKFDVESFSDDEKLNGLYLLGFHNQTSYTNTYRKNKDETNENDPNEDKIDEIQEEFGE